MRINSVLSCQDIEYGLRISKSANELHKLNGLHN